MSKQEINTRLIKQYLSDPSGLGRLYREQQSSQGKGKMEDELPETNERVLALAREAGAEIARRRRRRFYVPVALAAPVLVAVVAVQLLRGRRRIPRTSNRWVPNPPRSRSCVSANW